MAKITRKTAVQFSTTGAGTDVEQFASFEVNGTPNYTTSPATIQALPAWITGWSATQFEGLFAPYFQDRNAVDLVTFYQLAYLLQQGIPEYDAGTTYFIHSIVQQAGQAFISLQNNNIGNPPPAGSSNAFWELALNPANPSLYPTRTVFTSPGGVFYTAPAGCVRLYVRAVGGGGGAGTGNNTSGVYVNGGNGGLSDFFNESTLKTIVQANGGQGGQNVGKTSSAGGTAVFGNVLIAGGAGQGYVDTLNYAGGNSKFGGGGPAQLGVTTGISGVANSGGGGGGYGGGSGFYGCGGAAGGYADALIVAPGNTSFFVQVGVGGAAAVDSNGNHGGAGGSGIVIVDEFYY